MGRTLEGLRRHNPARVCSALRSFAAWPSASKREGTVGAGARAYGPSLEGDTAAARFTITGTDTGGFMGMPPTGKSVTVTGMDFMRFRTGECPNSLSAGRKACFASVSRVSA